ncbi:hypothetical protein QQF64_018297 [Cirrhinus molitorella]|uniref:AIG1-type G domain-containing protein n=1 Tax=Cirrhinus molitorella TaxID=172907 RepID=A0ABR3LEI8_9TELE
MDDQTGSLTITNTRTTDSGLYELQIRGSDRLQKFILTVSQSGLSPGAKTGIVFAVLLFVVAAVGGVIYHRHTISELQKRIRRRCSFMFDESSTPLRLVLVGMTGAGKSSSGNTILGRKAFRTANSPSSVTKECSKETENVAGREIAVVDTPGMFDTDLSQEELLKQKISKCINMTAPGPHAIILVIKLDMFIEEERHSVEKIRAIFGEEADKHTMVLFTHSDELTGFIEDFIEANEALKEVLNRCGGGYHVFNNEDMQNRNQVVELLQKIDAVVAANGDEHYTSDLYQDVENMLKPEDLKKIYKEELQELEARFAEEVKELQERIKTQTASEQEKEKQIREFERLNKCKMAEYQRYYKAKLREARQEAEQTLFSCKHFLGHIFMMAEVIGGLSVVLLGRTGTGKSSSGNTILGKAAFKSMKSSTSVTQDKAVESETVCGQRVTVFDTPGLFHTEMSDSEILTKYEEVLQKCESVPCAFLLVIKADRFTDKERQTVEKIEELLGEERLKKTWILFTRGDKLEDENITIEKYIDLSEPLKKVIQKYDQRYHVFNNKTKGPSEQARLLIEKMIQSLKDLPENREKSVTGQSIPDQMFKDSKANVSVKDTSEELRDQAKKEMLTCSKAIFERLNLKGKNDQKLRAADVLQLTKHSLQSQESCTEEELIQTFIQKLLLMDYRASE